MKTIKFEKTASDATSYNIIVNEKKAGLIRMFGQNDSSTTFGDWRVFFWGMYSSFQLPVSVFKSEGVFDKCTLESVIKKLQETFTSNPELLFAPKHYEKKGHVLLHASNGQILTVSTEYDYGLTEFYSLNSKDILFDTESKLKEVSDLMIEKYSGKGLWLGDITHVEFKMFEPIFDTSYNS